MTTKRIKTRTHKLKLPRSVKRMFPQVEYAVDAAQPVEVLVNLRDCESAEKLNPMECALAKAAKRELHADGIIIGLASSYIIKGNKAVRFNTPESVQREIVSFDRHGDFAPGYYHLPPKSPTARFGVHHHRKNKKGNVDKSSKKRIHTSVRVRVLDKGSENI